MTQSLRCSRCGETKSLDEFRKDNRKASGRSMPCKSCQNAITQAWKKRTNYKASKESVKLYGLKSRYGLTAQQYQKMVEAQNGCCAICGQVPTKAYGLQVDHDHATGKVRALLCHACNVVIGFVNENPDLILRVAKYLNEHQVKARHDN